MFWRYLSLTLLLLSSGSRILTSASFEVPTEDREEGLGLAARARDTDDALIDRIVTQLLASEEKSSGKTHAEEPSKRDDLVNSEKPSSSEGGSRTQAESQEPKNSNGGSSAADVSGKQNINGGGGDANGSEHHPETHHHKPGRVEALVQGSGSQEENKDLKESTKVIKSSDRDFIITMGAISCVGFVGLMMAGVCYYKFRRSAKAASDVEYPAYGVTGPMKERVPSPGDRKLAQSAQMYHYQHQKQQMIAMEKANGDMKHDASDDDSEEDNVEGDYTVYECPGLAPTGEMEVKNPLFRGEEAQQAPPAPTHQPGVQHSPARE